MLVENAIKHNIVADENPLHIVIFEEGGFVCVKNNIQRKKTLNEPSAGVGLENIRKRYELLTHIPVSVVDDGANFEVRLPILQTVQ